MSTASEEDDKFLSEDLSNGPSLPESEGASGEGEESEGAIEDDDAEEGEEEDGEEEDGEAGDAFPAPAPQQHNFAPPFYGRPPTPLPPSPSLTSLLRPSRPTTPDASDDELEPVPRASPKVPTYEYYGFVLYLFSSLSFLIYLLWSYLPSPFLHALGIYYYPNRWWSLAVPSFLVMALVYIYAALAAYNAEIMTLPMSSIETVVDDAAKVAVVDSRGRIKGARSADRRNRRRRSSRKKGEGAGGGAGGSGGGVCGAGTGPGGLDWRNIWNEGTDAVMDVPLGGVCEVLYGAEGRDEEDLGDGEEVW